MKVKTVYKAIPYTQWITGLWDDYEVYGYTFFGNSDIPHTVELKKKIEEDDNISFET
jgi:hypothetical protein